MSTLKKVISIVLCISLLAGTVAFVGDLIVPKANAAAGTSNIKPYAELEAAYDSFIYLGLEAYEADGTLTDGYVQPGDEITFRMYIKSDRYMGNGTYYSVYDNSFFDVTNVTHNASKNYTAYSGVNYETNSQFNGNSGHPLTSEKGLYAIIASKPAKSMTQFTSGNVGIDASLYNAWDLVILQGKSDSTNIKYAHRFVQDEYVYEWYATVKAGLADGTTGYAEIREDLFKHLSPKKLADVPSLTISDPGADHTTVLLTQMAGLYNQAGTINEFNCDDARCDFTIGENPADTPVVVTSNIKPYAELEAAYDSFIYLGLEAYEADGTLTDGYVQPGDEITFRMYIKSDRYMGNGTYYSVYDNSFFDVTNVTHNASKNYTAYSGVNYETNSQFNGNSGHPLTSEKGLYAIIASKPAKSMTQFTSGNVGIDASLYNAWDLVILQGKSDSTNIKYAHRFVQDEYVYEWYATVKAGLADGTTGYAEIREDLFKHLSPKKLADVPSLTISDPGADHTTVLLTQMAGLYNQAGTINEFNCDDARCDFTIGENPSSGANKYTAKFLENDGTELSASKYDVGAAVTVPDAVASQLGWADTSTGKLVDLTDYVMPKKNVEFKRVLTTDTFPLVINLDGGAVDGANLPAGVTDNGDGTLTANVPLNTEFDLTAIPVPEKAGYTASWNPEKIAVNSIKGATAKVVWTANTYKATFYLNKGDAEPFKVIDIAYGATLTCSGAAKDGFKFAGWVDAATDSKVSSTASVGKYNFTENKSYYADWTEYACSIAIMVRDYANGGWKLAATKYADSGTLKLNDIKACATAEVLGWDAEIAATDKQVGSSPDGWAADTNIKSDVSFEGDKVVYVYTKLSFEVTWKIPVYDAETDSYTDSFKDVAPVTVKTGYNEGVTDSTGVDAFTTYAKCSADYAAPLGYTMTGWYKTGSDEPSEYNDRLGIALTYSDGAKVEFTAKYELTKYDIIFNIRNGNYANKIKLDGALTKGESIVIEGASFTNASGKDSPVLNEAILPTVGLENTQQPNGGYGGMDGYEFDGWVLGVGAYATELLAFPMEITSDMISQYAKNGAIEFNAQWTALEYDLKFYYKTSDGEWTDTPIVITLPTGSSIKKPSGADLDMIQANAPKGEKFTGAWLLEDGSADSSMTMPAFGRDYYAKYGTASLGAYIDYNSGKTDEEGQLLPLKDTMIRYPGLDTNPLNYADDAERKEDVDAGIKRGVAYDIMNAHISDTNKPGEFYEIVGWNVYHVDYGADVYNKDNWKPGYNDEGSTIAYSDIIFQAEWKSHDDFLFRVYDTDGKLYKAVGKNLKTYYWLNGYVSNRNDSKLNKSPDILVVLMLVPSVENWDVNRFFDIEMWRSLHLRFDAFALPKSMFTWESFKGLMEALGNAIRELIGSKAGDGDETTEGDVVAQATEAVNTQGFKFIG